LPLKSSCGMPLTPLNFLEDLAGGPQKPAGSLSCA
jgi:hypothetical protein